MNLKQNLIIVLALFTLSCGVDSESTSKDAINIIQSTDDGLDSLSILKRQAKLDNEYRILRDQMLKENDRRGNHIIVEYTIDTLRINNNHFSYLYNIEDVTTAGMCKAIWYAYDEYDKLLNKYYKLLLNRLKPEDRKILQEAQRSWLEYRDKEIKLISTVYYSNGGSIQIIFCSIQILKVVKDRVQYLFDYIVEIESL